MPGVNPTFVTFVFHEDVIFLGRLKSCPYCGRVHAIGIDCGCKPKRKKEDTERTKLRTCRQWDKIRSAARERDGNLCRVCLAECIITVDNLEVHHIVPLVESPDKAYDLDNVITLCVKHHKVADAGKLSRDKLYRLVKDPPWVQ